uniref:Putative cytochrome P450 n=1 Tax=Moniliophthora roreri TaxID=221103 RepID=A0A0W0FD70_MONRR
MNTIGKELLADRKKSFDSHDGKDVLSLLLKHNSLDVPEGQRMSDLQILAQVPMFLVAGHETTSTATTWALYCLTGNLDIQRKLCLELLSVPTDTPAMEQLNALPYLGAIIRETLRLFPPVTFTNRVAVKNDVIPLSEPYTDKNGVVHHTLRIKCGTEVQIPIVSLHHDTSLWGDNALEFR